MGVRRGRLSRDRLLEEPSSRGLVAIPLVLIVAITVLDLYRPADVYLGPLLVIAPALTASLSGTRMTALVGALAVATLMLIGVLEGGLTNGQPHGADPRAARPLRPDSFHAIRHGAA
jgi:hypothetical protein